MRLLGRLARRVGGAIVNAGSRVREAALGPAPGQPDRTPWIIARFRKAWAAVVGSIVAVPIIWLKNKTGIDLTPYGLDFTDAIILAVTNWLTTYASGANAPRAD